MSYIRIKKENLNGYIYLCDELKKYGFKLGSKFTQPYLHGLFEEKYYKFLTVDWETGEIGEYFDNILCDSHGYPCVEISIHSQSRELSIRIRPSEILNFFINSSKGLDFIATTLTKLAFDGLTEIVPD